MIDIYRPMKLKLVRTVVVAPIELVGGVETKEESSSDQPHPENEPHSDAGISAEIDADTGNAEEGGFTEQVAPQSPTAAENGSQPTSSNKKISHEEIARRIQALMDAKEAKKRHKQWLATAVKVEVQQHPLYAEYVKLANCGVDDNTLRELMEKESTEEKPLDFGLLRNPFQVSSLQLVVMTAHMYFA